MSTLQQDIDSYIKGLQGRVGSPVETINGKPIDSSPRIIDPDTIAVGDTSYRLQGFNMPETAKQQGGIMVPSNERVRGTQGYVDKIARLGGYTNLETTGKKDPYGRVLADQTNSQGMSLGDLLTAVGVAKVNQHSSEQAVREGMQIQGYSRLFPEMADRDLILREANKFKEEELKSLGGNPLYAPRQIAFDEKEYAGISRSVGIPAVKEEVDEIARLERILANETLSPSKRQDLHNKLKESRERLYLAATTPNPVRGVLVRNEDRNMMNQAHRQFRTSLYHAGLDMVKGFGGLLEMAGDDGRWEWLAEKGREISRAKTAQMETLPETLSSYRDIRTDNPWVTVTDSATYVTNLFAGTIPHLALITASTVATGGMGPVLGFTLSSVPSSLLYMGSIYADQEEGGKNPELAAAMGISAGVLDRIGFAGMFMKSNVFTTVGRKEIIEQMVAKGMRPDDASKLLLEATKKELVDLSGMGAEFARKQYLTSQSMLRSTADVLARGGSEGFTESLQTLAEMVGSYGEWNLDAQYERHFYDNLVDGFIGGKAMGSTIGLGAAAIDASQWHSIADALADNDRQLTENQAFMTDQINRAAYGPVDTKNPAVNSVEGAVGYAKGVSTATRGGLRDLPASEGAWNGFKAVMMDPIRLFRSLVNTAVPSVVKKDGTFKYNLAYLGAIMGKMGLLPGNHYAGYKQRLVGSFGGMTAESLAHKLKLPVAKAEGLVKDAWINYWSKGKELPQTGDNLLLQAWKNEADLMIAKMKAVADSEGIQVPELLGENPLFESVSIDPVSYMKNRDRVVEALMAAGVSRKLADEASRNIASGDPAKASSSRRFMAEHGIFSNPELKDIFEENIFHSMENLKQDIAARVANEKYLGEDGQYLANLLKAAWEAGEFESEHQYRDTVKNVRDWYDIVSGKYNTLDNYPFIQNVIGWGSTLVMLATLGKATISSMPEIAISTMGTNGNKVKDQLRVYWETFAAEYKSDINRGTSFATAKLGLDIARSIGHENLRGRIEDLENQMANLKEGDDPSKYKNLEEKVRKLYSQDIGRNLFEVLGYNETGYNTQTRFELTEANHRKAMQAFSSIIGLRAMTDATRIAALSVGADIINSKLTNLRLIPAESRGAAFSTGKGMSKSQFQDLKELQSFGMNVHAMLELMEKIPDNIESFFTKEALSSSLENQSSVQAQIADQLMTTLGNMLDSKVVNPQAHNMPKYYHDPRFRIFTVMTRFIAALHATILPKLYRDYIVQGDAGMRYQAFSIIAAALALGWISNWLKDELSYEDGTSPYIRTAAQKAQRALYGSGLTGRFEKVIDAVVPLYPDRKPNPLNNPLGFSYATARDLAPPIAWGDSFVRGMYNVLQGDTEKGAGQLARTMPIVGSFPSMRKDIADQFKE